MKKYLVISYIDDVTFNELKQAVLDGKYDDYDIRVECSGCAEYIPIRDIKLDYDNVEINDTEHDKLCPGCQQIHAAEPKKITGRHTPCDDGDCPFDAVGGMDCRDYCGLGVDDDDYDDDYDDDDDDDDSETVCDNGNTNIIKHSDGSVTIIVPDDLVHSDIYRDIEEEDK